MAFLDETGLAELWSLTKNLANSKARVQSISYTGTGTLATSSSPKTMTFSFTPKIVIGLARVSTSKGTIQGLDDGADGSITRIPIDVLTTSFKKDDYAPWGADTYMKFDPSSNKLSWYSTEDSNLSGTSVIWNNADYTYYWLAIG